MNRFGHVFIARLILALSLGVLLVGIDITRPVLAQRFGSSTGPGMMEPSNDETGRVPDPAAKQRTAEPILLREGTRVGPMAGRFVRSGKIWRFVPASSNPSRMPKGDAGTSSSTSKISGGGNQWLSRQGTLDEREDRRGATTLSTIVVIENLMLDRVSRAIDQDSSDANWTITGKVTEFRDENRLMLTTVRRAPINVQDLQSP
ncbi:MAG: hypothetical protein AAGJ40_01615 [Planctomycetota bacterium]